MRTCVIYNPAAKGQKAGRLRSRLDIISQHAQLKKTAAAGDARRLAAEAIAEGCDTIVAAGGDGTINEVLNGIGDANAFERVRLGLLPLGTINVFALELGIPFPVEAAWKIILAAKETRIDLPWADFFEGGEWQRRYFAQLAGAGLDARAIELVDWSLKKRFGGLAYAIAGCQALFGPQSKITVTAEGRSVTGELMLIGNGKLYGGRMAVCPQADLRDGLLDVCVFPRVKLFPALGNALHAVVRGTLPESGVQRLRAATFTLTAREDVRPTSMAAFQLDGEWAGHLPATFGVAREKLRVIVP